MCHSYWAGGQPKIFITNATKNPVGVGQLEEITVKKNSRIQVTHRKHSNKEWNKMVGSTCNFVGFPPKWWFNIQQKGGSTFETSVISRHLLKRFLFNSHVSFPPKKKAFQWKSMSKSPRHLSSCSHPGTTCTPKVVQVRYLQAWPSWGTSDDDRPHTWRGNFQSFGFT